MNVLMLFEFVRQALKNCYAHENGNWPPTTPHFRLKDEEVKDEEVTRCEHRGAIVGWDDYSALYLI